MKHEYWNRNRVGFLNGRMQKDLQLSIRNRCFIMNKCWSFMPSFPFIITLFIDSLLSLNIFRIVCFEFWQADKIKQIIISSFSAMCCAFHFSTSLTSYIFYDSRWKQMFDGEQNDLIKRKNWTIRKAKSRFELNEKQ